MKGLLSFIFIFFGLNVYAVDEYVSDIYYGNGIMTSAKEADITLNKTIRPAVLHDIYKGDVDKMNRYHHFDVAYNYSFKENFGDTAPALILDLMESYEQLGNTSVGWEVFGHVVDAVQDYLLGGKVIKNFVTKDFVKVLVKYAPVITLNGQADVSLSVGENYVELGATAVDAVDGNVSVNISGTVDTNTAGTYTITYTATDSVGNEANVTRSVTVVAPTFTSITLESNATTLSIGEKATLTLLGTYPDNSTEVLTKNIEYIISPSQSVELNASTLTALKDGTVTLQAKVGTLLSNMLTLDIAWVVDGHVLPPEPDEALNDSTLLGIDANNNGVRDDVERWIYKKYDTYIPCVEKDTTYTLPSGKVIRGVVERKCEDEAIPYHPIVRAIAMQGARAAQIIIQEPEKARETREVFAKAYLCSIVVDDKKDLNGRKMYKEYIFGDEFKKIQFNTIKRARAFGEYNFNLSGGVYDLPTDDVILQGCSMEVHKLLEGLK